MSFPLSLRPTFQRQGNADSLSSVIEQIFVERGHLRDITEESLRGEAQAETTRDSANASDDDEVETPQDAQARVKEIQTARMEMLQLVGQANNDALTALDFISLLLSREAPRQAESSISPALKSMTPIGTLGYDMTDASKPTKAEVELDEKIALGFNFESLSSSADKLIGSAERLGKEIQKETRYWEQLLSVSEKEWDLCRVPGQRHTVGVRFGFSEAAPKFQARSLAALRSDDNGDLYMDQESSNNAKSIRVRIFKGEDLIESSSPPLLATDDGNALDVLVQQARDSVYDEELFFELSRDARNWFSKGVRTSRSGITVPLEASVEPDTSEPMEAPRKLVIDLIPRPRSSTTAGPTADRVVLTLRLLLSYAYCQKYRRRSEPPPPMTMENVTAQKANLLQPLLSHLDFISHTRLLCDSLLLLTRTLRSAGLECSLEINHEFGTRLSSFHEQNRSSRTTMEQIGDVISGPLTASFSFDLPDSTKIGIRLTTDLSPPSYGTVYNLTHAPPHSESQNEAKSLYFSDVSQLIPHVEKLLRDAILAHVAQSTPGWTLDKTASELRASTPENPKRLSVSVSDGRLVVITNNSAVDPKVKSKGTIAGAWDDEPREGQSTLLAVCAAAS